MRRPPGQVLIGAVLLMALLGILVPAIVYYAMNESKWTEKERQSTTAFQLAEAATERGYWEIAQSSAPYDLVPIAGYSLDKAYADVSGGEYAISIASDSSMNMTILGVGRDTLKKEIRAIQVVYANANAGNQAVSGGSGVQENGNNMRVEWGSITSPSTIYASWPHPSLWSKGAISPYDTANTPPNCDSPNCWWWHAYDQTLQFPTVDLGYYQGLAQAAGASPCGGNYYTVGDRSGACNDTSGNTYYVTGEWEDFDGPIVGNVIVLKDMTTRNGAMHGESINAAMPPQAWKQYCNDWSYYLTNYNDSYAQTHYPSACPGLSSSYLSASNITAPISPVVQGLMYVGQDFTTGNGLGNATILYGVLVVGGNVNLNGNSHAAIYYSSGTAANVRYTNTIYTRQSWEELLEPWPSGLP